MLNVSQLIKLDSKRVEPDAYMQKLTHFTVSKNWQQKSCGESPPQHFGRGGDRPHSVGVDCRRLCYAGGQGGSDKLEQIQPNRSQAKPIINTRTALLLLLNPETVPLRTLFLLLLSDFQKFSKALSICNRQGKKQGGEGSWEGRRLPRLAVIWTTVCTTSLMLSTRPYYLPGHPASLITRRWINWTCIPIAPVAPVLPIGPVDPLSPGSPA